MKMIQIKFPICKPVLRHPNFCSIDRVPLALDTINKTNTAAINHFSD